MQKNKEQGPEMVMVPNVYTDGTTIKNIPPKDKEEKDIRMIVMISPLLEGIMNLTRATAPTAKREGEYKRAKRAGITEVPPYTVSKDEGR